MGAVYPPYRSRLAATLLLAILVPLLQMGSTTTDQSVRADNRCANGDASTWLHTCGALLVDPAGAQVQLHAVNWYGFESNDFVAGGLQHERYSTIIATIKSLHFNAVRIPISNELIERDPIVSRLGPICVAASCLPITGRTILGPNRDLYGKTALQILQTVVDAAGQSGLYVILDDHRSRAGWGPQENGLWYTGLSCPSTAIPYSCYTPGSWLNDWAALGVLFQNDPFVTGLDLRNELHSAHLPTSCASYVREAHWGACRGENNLSTDWPRAATRAGNLLLHLNPHWIIAVEGVSTYPRPDGSFPIDGWAQNLQGVATDPIILETKGRLIYSPHDYRWDQPTANIAAMRAAWTRTFGFIAIPDHPYSAPLWIGEFGTCTDRIGCMASRSDSAGRWYSEFMSYTTTPPNGILGPLSWAYWSINGTTSDAWTATEPLTSGHWLTCYGQREDYGLLGSDWTTLTIPSLSRVLLQMGAAPHEANTAVSRPSTLPWAPKARSLTSPRMWQTFSCLGHNASRPNGLRPSAGPLLSALFGPVLHPTHPISQAPIARAGRHSAPPDA